ncbi:hypothetical protein CHLRE_09g389950v5 [Chlamydomonas reinhardtii]|uniref:Cas1p 10 TM acyl transferase domain-containing protein n=1 Tax=Chlamydomonas reinhardtii TaxID=3055 RepID=A0A2K3DDJ4_CHLRE|nr:uncharacterized protein CHLRE_09g389950v5 [Chlamydomonas reinhardtii]PNW78612.1 hypothetical protein CHLRE_09g389950v5 [Chlamydomonas reinhardtii]
MTILTSPITSGQATFLVAFVWSLLAWIASEVLNWLQSFIPTKPGDEERDDSETGKLLPTTAAVGGGGAAAAVTATVSTTAAAHHGANGAAPADANAAAAEKPLPPAVPAKPAASVGFGVHGNMLTSIAHSGFVDCLLMKRKALLKHRLTLRTTVEFGALMCWYFLCDRTTVFGEGEKSYSRDLFVFLFVILTSVAVGSSLQAFKMPLLLNRPQTEEWKGWMQVLFLLYHYFEAREAYNAIRIFIAGYVWMTGFGNFSYYYKTGDFCIGRFAQMMWRLNFMVFFTCVVLNNSYMLYYICPMHTIFTVFVYAALAIAPQYNQNNFWCLMKIAACFLFIFVTWDLKTVFYAIWTPFTFLMGYNDPRKPTNDALHEWYFRSSLDRYIWIYGMLCAFMHPPVAALLKYIDEMPIVRRVTVRSFIISLCGVAGYFYYVHIYCLPKLEYNQVHPYTSWIPITLWIILRNMTPWLRIHHLRLYGWLGCVTLETYISQFHIWMKTVIPDGQPKSLLVFIPGYPLLNFALVSALYILISHRLFELTNTLKNAVVPHSNDSLLARNCVMMAVIGLALWAVVALIYNLVVIVE